MKEYESRLRKQFNMFSCLPPNTSGYFQILCGFACLRWSVTALTFLNQQRTHVLLSFWIPSATSNHDCILLSLLLIIIIIIINIVMIIFMIVFIIIFITIFIIINNNLVTIYCHYYDCYYYYHYCCYVYYYWLFILLIYF